MNTQTINQTVTLDATPLAVYQAFLDPAAHGEFTGAPAEITDRVGDDFSAHGGYCFGKNLELIPGQKIVQSWAAHDDNWPEGADSKITISLEAAADQTVLKFVHEHVPEQAAESIANGWVTYYWEPMKAYFINIMEL